MSRTAKAEPLLIPIALGASIYIHPRNPVDELTVDQMTAICSGRDDLTDDFVRHREFVRCAAKQEDITGDAGVVPLHE